MPATSRRPSPTTKSLSSSTRRTAALSRCFRNSAPPKLLRSAVHGAENVGGGTVPGFYPNLFTTPLRRNWHSILNVGKLLLGGEGHDDPCRTGPGGGSAIACRSQSSGLVSGNDSGTAVAGNVCRSRCAGGKPPSSGA